MVKWFKKRVIKWVRDDWNNAGKLAAEVPQPLRASRDVDPISDSDPILNFRVFSAVGGKVVEFTHYDRKTDRRHSTTYIITNEQDFGERIAKISTMEVLKS